MCNRFSGQLLASLTLIALACGCKASTADTDAGASKTAPRPVVAPLDDRGHETEERRYVAVVVPTEWIDVVPKIAGELLETRYRMGERVKKGDVIAIIDDKQAKDALEQATARLASLRATYDATLSTSASARRRAKTVRKMVKDGIAPRKDLDDAEDAADQARHSVRRAKATLNAQRVEVAQLQRHLNETEVVADFAGTISTIYQRPGSMVGPNRPILKLIGSGERMVRFAVPPHQSNDVAPGDSVRIEVVNPKMTLRGTVRRKAPEENEHTHFIYVEASLTEMSNRERRRLNPGGEAWVIHRPLRLEDPERSE